MYAKPWVTFLFGLFLGRVLLDVCIQPAYSPSDSNCKNYLERDGKAPMVEIEQEHIDGPNCWCKPQLFFEGLDEFADVWVHKGHGEEMPPSHVLAQAIADAIRQEQQ